MIQVLRPHSSATVLRHLDQRAGESEYHLATLPVVIGKGVGADIRLADEFASECHCVIKQQDGRVILRDDWSDNGTFLNGERVRETELTPGDRIAVGLSVFEADAS